MGVLIFMIATLFDCENIYAKIWDHPRILFGDSYLVTKFRVDLILLCRNYNEFNFSPVWLENK